MSHSDKVRKQAIRKEQGNRGGLESRRSPNQSVARAALASLAKFAMLPWFLLPACSPGERTALFEAEGARYRIPKADIVSISPADSAPNEAKFIWLEPNGTPFRLMWDELTARIRDRIGTERAVANVNVPERADAEYVTKDGRVYVCVPHPSWTECGTNIRDGGLTWSLIFNRTHLENSASLVRQAEQRLADYRGAAK